MSDEGGHHGGGRPPFFDGTKYAEWKVILREPSLPKVNYYHEDVLIEVEAKTSTTFALPEGSDDAAKKAAEAAKKKGEEPTEFEKKNQMLDATAKGILYKSLSSQEFVKIKNLKTAHKIWAHLEAAYEGSSHIKRAKRMGHKAEYEKFGLMPNESPNDMYARLIELVGNLWDNGEEIGEVEVVEKMLRVSLRTHQQRSCLVNSHSIEAFGDNQ